LEPRRAKLTRGKNREVHTISACAGGTAANERGADVLPLRQKNGSKIDYCRCPTHTPRLLR